MSRLDIGVCVDLLCLCGVCGCRDLKHCLCDSTRTVTPDVQLKAVPELVKTKQDIVKLTGTVQGACHDVEYALATVQQMHQIASFESLQAHTQKAIEYQQAISRSYRDSLPSLKEREDAARMAASIAAMDKSSGRLLEPVGVFSSSLRTGETPESGLSPEMATTGEMQAVSTTSQGSDGGGSRAGDAVAVVGGAGGSGSGADDAAPKKKKKKKKEIVVKSF